MAEQEKKKRNFRFPILAKAAISIFVFALIVVEIAMTYYSVVMSNKNTSTYKNIANSVSGTIAKVIDTNDVSIVKNKVKSILDIVPASDRYVSDEDDPDGSKTDAYMSYFAPLKLDADFRAAFNNVRSLLRDVVEANEANTIDCAYLSFVYTYNDEQGIKQGLFVYLVDSAFTYDDEGVPEEELDEYACPPGWLDPVYSVNKDVITNPERGFPAYTTDTGYGKLMTSGATIKLGANDYVYACTDFSLTKIRAEQANSIVRLFAYLIITVNVLAGIGLLLVHFLFSRRIKILSVVAKSFNKEDPLRSHSEFENLKVKSHDELADLTNSIKTMENSVLEQITNLTRANEALIGARNQAHKMSVLANKDPLTGVQSKVAYHSKAEELNELMTRNSNLTFGVAMIDLNYLKNTNDEFGHDVGDESLIKLANMICITFKHSPVYRFGGDEFVVILNNEDYRNSKELLAELEERIEASINDEKTPLYKRISAAVGYAAYDNQRDTCFEDVFKRADRAMYAKKHEMKGSD